MRCRGCNKLIKVAWRAPEGALVPILEDLCHVCLAWAASAEEPGPMKEPALKRRPVNREEYDE